MPDNTQLHNSVVLACRQYIGARGGWSVKIGAGPYQRAGLADLLAGLRHPHDAWPALLFVEIKTGRGTLRPAQCLVKEEVEHTGIPYLVVSCVEALEDWLYAQGFVPDKAIRRRRQA